MSRVRQKKAYWIGGTLLAFGGVALARLLAPELEELYSRWAKAAGYILVIAGLMIIGLATRRKGSEAFITRDREPGRGNGHAGG